MKKIINYFDRNKEFCYKKVLDIINILDDYDIEINVSNSELKIILNEIYNLYFEKGIIYQYLEDMTCYFNEICLSVSEESSFFTVDIIFNGLINCHGIVAPVEIERDDLIKKIEKAKVKIKNRRFTGEK